ncbi:MAG TPA: hypothetical protein VJV79_35925 [Polyangiaceae bacterium]|nr:hypothetical protein [Polyangiaceae bacterium]
MVIGWEVMGAFRFVVTLPSATCLCTALAVCLLSSSPASAASDEEKAGARAAATQGQAAYEHQRWAESLDLFTRAESLVHSPVHLLYKARSLVQLGQLVKAREAYLSITRDDSASTAPAVLKAREDAAKELSQIEPRLASLTVKVEGPGATEASVEMDGVRVPIALVGVARPADPGQHTLQASANGAAANPQTVTLKEGGTATITLLLEPIPGGAPVVPLAPAQPVTSPPMTSAAVDANSATESGNGLRTGSYIAFGVGVAGVALGTVFALKAKSNYSDGNDLCQNQDPCQLSSAEAAQREQLGKDGDSAKTISIISFVAGGVGLAAGTTLFILSGKKQNEPARAGVHPWLGLGSAGVSGRF